MNKEKQYLRNLIDSSIKIQDKNIKHVFYLCYNKNYIRALKLSKITGKPVNIDNFNRGEKIFGFNTNDKTFNYYSKIYDYLEENYSKRMKIIIEVFNEYNEYKGYIYWLIYD